MGGHIVYLARLETGISHRGFDNAPNPVSAFVWSGGVMRVAAHRIPDDLRSDGGLSFHGTIEALDDKDACPLSEGNAQVC